MQRVIEFFIHRIYQAISHTHTHTYTPLEKKERPLFSVAVCVCVCVCTAFLLTHDRHTVIRSGCQLQGEQHDLFSDDGSRCPSFHNSHIKV